MTGASLSDILMAPIGGWHDAGDVIGFVFCLGAFLSILNATGALETGIHVLVKKLHGKELALVWILMFLFSVGGTTYGMGEETGWLLHPARSHHDGRRLRPAGRRRDGAAGRRLRRSGLHHQPLRHPALRLPPPAWT